MAHNQQRIPGAEHLDIRYLRDMSKPYPNMFPTDKHFIDKMKARSIKLSTQVILYDSKIGQPYWSTRGYLLFSAMGHPNVKVLNGGLTKWIAEGKPIESSKDLANWD